MSTSSPLFPDVVTETPARVDLSTGRNEAELASDTSRDYPAKESQTREIQQALQEADDGDFASADDVRAIAQKWGGTL